MIKTRSLPTKLTREEREIRAAQLTETISKHDQVDGEKKAAAAKYKQQLDDLNAEIRKLAAAVNAWFVWRKNVAPTVSILDCE